MTIYTTAVTAVELVHRVVLNGIWYMEEFL